MAGIHVGDVGTLLRFQIVEPDPDAPEPDAVKAVDLTGGAVTLRFRKPSCADPIERAAVVEAGALGWVNYTTVAGDIDEAGTWKVEGVPALPLGTWTSDPVSFAVKSNL